MGCLVVTVENAGAVTLSTKKLAETHVSIKYSLPHVHCHRHEETKIRSRKSCGILVSSSIVCKVWIDEGYYYLTNDGLYYLTDDGQRIIIDPEAII